MAMSDIKTTWRPVKAWVDPVVTEICSTRPIYFVWGHSNGTSGEHPLGRALDFSVLEYGNGVKDPGPARPALGEEITAYLWKHRHRLNIWYVIWNRRIITTNPKAAGYNRWIPYTGKSSHTDHVHVSFNRSGVYHPPASTHTVPPMKEDDDMPTAQEIANALLNSPIGDKGNLREVLEEIHAVVHSDYKLLKERIRPDVAEIKADVEDDPA